MVLSYPSSSSSGEFDHVQARVAALAHLRKESLNLYNRLHSIEEDIEFINEVRSFYPRLPILPNLRCGGWYVNPSSAHPDAAYFKSTDGHFNNWSFNLRRPNLHLLPIAIHNGGLILVDSTRAGKRMPDALSKTVPIWCSVINRAVKKAYNKPSLWDVGLYCPPGAVSAQEYSQIERLVDGWAASLLESSYSIPDLTQPLRPLWITPSTTAFPSLPAKTSFLPILCVSASKQIEDGLERRIGGFSYVQGSGDDHELWGHGLTPEVFWENKEVLLRADKSQLPEVVKGLVCRRNSEPLKHWATPPTPIERVGGRLLVCAVADVPSDFPAQVPGVSGRVAYVIISEHAKSLSLDCENILALELPPGKKGQIHFLQHVLPHAAPFIERELESGNNVCVCCETGRDASVGVAVVALQLFFDEHGQYIGPRPSDENVSKRSIAKRLQWVISSRPEANPSRVTLKRVNEYLMTPPDLRRRVAESHGERTREVLPKC